MRETQTNAQKATTNAKFKRDKFLSRNNLPFVNLLDKDLAVNALLHRVVADMISFVLRVV
jgi:hypothetical protein